MGTGHLSNNYIRRGSSGEYFRKTRRSWDCRDIHNWMQLPTASASAIRPRVTCKSNISVINICVAPPPPPPTKPTLLPRPEHQCKHYTFIKATSALSTTWFKIWA